MILERKVCVVVRDDNRIGRGTTKIKGGGKYHKGLSFVADGRFH